MAMTRRARGLGASAARNGQAELRRESSEEPGQGRFAPGEDGLMGTAEQPGKGGAVRWENVRAVGQRQQDESV